MRDHVYVAGHGRLASKIQADLEAAAQQHNLPLTSVENWDHIPADIADSSRIVLVHAGSGRQFHDVVAFCGQYRTPLVQCATGIDYPHDLFHSMDFTFVDAPNLSIPIIKLLYLLEQMGPLFREYDIAITESHQRAKTSLAGTALEIARLLGVDSQHIRSIRDEQMQESRLSIPPEHVKQHALHMIEIAGDGCKMTLTTEVYGLESYLIGLVRILQSIEKLSTGRYRLADLVRGRVV